jgi:hypothetical protein
MQKHKLVHFQMALLIFIGLSSHSSPAFDRHQLTEVAPGDTVEVNETFQFYFYSVDDISSVAVVRPEAVEAALKSAKWIIPDGLTLKEHGLEVNVAKIAWNEGSMSYTAQGYVLSVKGRVLVGEGAHPGNAELQLALPGLPALASLLGVQVNFPSEYKSPPKDPLNIQSVLIYESQGALKGKNNRDLTIAAIVVSLILIPAIWGSIRTRRVKNQKN